MDELKNAATALGRKGGLSTSEKKAKAARENGKKGGRSHLVVSMKNIKVKEKKKETRMVKGEKIKDPHVTGWRLSYEFPDGKITEKFYQKEGIDLKTALHQFFKACVEPMRTEYERK